MMTRVVRPGSFLLPGRSAHPVAPIPFHLHESNRRRKFRRELARRWDLLQLEEERKPTGRHG